MHTSNTSDMFILEPFNGERCFAEIPHWHGNEWLLLHPWANADSKVKIGAKEDKHRWEIFVIIEFMLKLFVFIQTNLTFFGITTKFHKQKLGLNNTPDFLIQIYKLVVDWWKLSRDFLWRLNTTRPPLPTEPTNLELLFQNIRSKYVFILYRC